MKNILIIGLALCMGVSLSSCDDNDVRPSMSLSPTGTMVDFDNDSTNTTDTTDFDLNPAGEFIDDRSFSPFDEISHFNSDL